MDCPSNILVVHTESHLNVSNYLVKSGKACADMLSSMDLQAQMQPKCLRHLFYDRKFNGNDTDPQSSQNSRKMTVSNIYGGNEMHF